MARLIREIRAPWAARLDERAGGVGEPAVPARQLQRQLRRDRPRRAPQAERRRGRLLPGLPLGRDHRAGAGRSPSRTSMRTPAITYPNTLDARADRGGDPPHHGGRGRQPLPSRPVLPAGRRHGAARRAHATSSIRGRGWAGASATIKVGGRPLARERRYKATSWASPGRGAGAARLRRRRRASAGARACAHRSSTARARGAVVCLGEGLCVYPTMRPSQWARAVARAAVGIGWARRRLLCCLRRGGGGRYDCRTWRSTSG